MRTQGVDTNLLIRWLLRDDAAQHRLVKAAFLEAERAGETLWISIPVLCELVWTLARSFGAKRAQIVEIVDLLLETTIFELQDRDVVRAALTDYVAGRGDFPDYLIGRAGKAAGCYATLTFDRDLDDSELFTVLT